MSLEWRDKKKPFNYRIKVSGLSISSKFKAEAPSALCLCLKTVCSDHQVEGQHRPKLHWRLTGFTASQDTADLSFSLLPLPHLSSQFTREDGGELAICKPQRKRSLTRAGSCPPLALLLSMAHYEETTLGLHGPTLLWADVSIFWCSDASRRAGS